MHLLLALTFLLMFPALIQAQMLLNGSFESPSLGVNGYAPGGGDDWTVSGSNTYIASNGTASAGNTSYGSQYLVLSSAGNSVAQTINSGFVIGQNYVLSLAAADHSREGDSLMVSVAGGASASTVFSIPYNINAGATNSSIPFLTYGLPFTVTTNNPVTITVSAISGTYQGFTVNGGEYIDNVVLAAPEPRTWIAAVLGIGVLGAVGRARRRLER